MSNTAGVPNLNSFAEAKARYENTTPIRGNADKVRPLGYRQYHRMASIAMPDADTVVFSYYGKPFVTWRSDNTFTVSNGVYQSAYTAKHLSYFLPRQWYTNWVDCAMVLRSYHQRYVIPRNATFRFVPSGESFDLVDKPVAYSIRKKRNSLKHELAQQQPFADWLTVISSVTNVVSDDEVTQASDVLRSEVGLRSHEWYIERRTATIKAIENSNDYYSEAYMRAHAEYYVSDNLPATFNRTYVNQRKFNPATCERLLQWVTGTDANKWVLAMNLIAGRTGRRRYTSGTGFSKAEYQAEQRLIMAFLHEITLHVYRDKAFYQEQMPDGVLPSRSNRHYFQVVNLPV